jgi:hypothetical protein
MLLFSLKSQSQSHPEERSDEGSPGVASWLNAQAISADCC